MVFNTSPQLGGTESKEMKRVWINVFVAVVVSIIIFCLGWLAFPEFYERNMRLMLVNLGSCVFLQTLAFICLEYGKAREID